MVRKKILPDDFSEMVSKHQVIPALSSHYNVNRSVISRWLKESNINALPFIDAIRRTVCKSIPMSEYLLSVFDGLMLSDGYLSYRKENGGYTANFSLGTPFKQYAMCVANTLTSLGLPSWINVYKQPIGPWNANPNKLQYVTSSTRTIELGKQIKRWYIESSPKNIKIVPKDISNSGKTWLWEYIGDGHLWRKSERSYGCLLATNAFTIEEQYFLVEKLNKIGINATIRGNKINDFNLYISNAKSFLSFIGNAPCNFFEYKWDMKEYKRKCHTCGKIIQERRKKYCSEICKFNPNAPHNICVVCKSTKTKNRSGVTCSNDCREYYLKHHSKFRRTRWKE